MFFKVLFKYNHNNNIHLIKDTFTINHVLFINHSISNINFNVHPFTQHFSTPNISVTPHPSPLIPTQTQSSIYTLFYSIIHLNPPFSSQYHIANNDIKLTIHKKQQTKSENVRTRESKNPRSTHIFCCYWFSISRSRILGFSNYRIVGFDSQTSGSFAKCVLARTHNIYI